MLQLTGPVLVSVPLVLENTVDRGKKSHLVIEQIDSKLSCKAQMTRINLYALDILCRDLALMKGSNSGKDGGREWEDDDQ